jgi:hypothetical protein
MESVNLLNVQIEIGIAAAAQIGALIWLLSRQSAQIANLTGWVKDVSALGSDTARLVAYLKGQIEGHIASTVGKVGG